MFARNYRARRRCGAQGHAQRRPHRGVRRALLAAVAAAGASGTTAVMVAQPAAASPTAPAAVKFTKLTLLHGWTNGAYSTSGAAVANVSGIVTFKGGIMTKGTNPVPFRLPKAFRPGVSVYVPVDLCGANYGHLYIQPNGVVTVQAEGRQFGNAACFTSLDGAWFAKPTTSFTTLTLKNGWKNEWGGGFRAAARAVSGIVYLKGAIYTSGTNPNPFILPRALRPATQVFVPIDLCGGTAGRLQIRHDGTVTVEAEISFADAQCSTSLDGASFAISAKSFTALTLTNGWTNAAFATSKAAARVISGIVHLKGGISTNGSSPLPFTLPKAFRPAHDVFVGVDLCSANNGRLDIKPNGTVTIEAEGGTFSHASCFTSLDGVSFAR